MIVFAASEDVNYSSNNTEPNPISPNTITVTVTEWSTTTVVMSNTFIQPIYTYSI